MRPARISHERLSLDDFGGRASWRGAFLYGLGDGAGHTYRIGTRWAAEPAFALALEASRGETDADRTTAATIRASLRW